MRDLNTQLDILYQVFGADVADASPAEEKLDMLKKFQTVVVIYICVDVIFHLWAQIFLIRVPWVEDMVEQMILMLTLQHGL